MQGVCWQEDGAIEVVRETTVTASDLHGDDDKFRDDTELGGEGGVVRGVAEGEADGAVRGDDFEEAGCEIALEDETNETKV